MKGEIMNEDKKIIVSRNELTALHNLLFSTVQTGENILIIGSAITALRQILETSPEFRMQAAEPEEGEEAENE